jgi:hypothetical protein
MLQALDKEGQQPGDILWPLFGGHGDAIGDAQQFGDREVGADGGDVLGAAEQPSSRPAPLLQLRSLRLCVREREKAMARHSQEFRFWIFP